MQSVNSSTTVWEPWMRRALQLAALAEGQTSPNPLVGAVVLDSSGCLVGEGFHLEAGKPHAEVGALAQARTSAIGGTLIVTLEPCCHQGRTPPCTEAILQAGISRVIVALEDPDPRVSGGGIERLKAAGLEVVTGVLCDEAAYQNRAFLHRVRTGRPWGILKWAMSLDGRTALPNGVSKWISSKESRTWVHSLRAQCDAVIIGGGTLRLDDPFLTSRGKSIPEPLRVVLTRSIDLPEKANLWDVSIAKTLIAHQSSMNEIHSSNLPNGPESLPLEECDPFCLMKALAKRGCNKVLWECGPILASAAIKQSCIQELGVVIAPSLLGGLPAKTPLADFKFSSIDQALSLDVSSINFIGTDFLFRGILNDDFQSK